MNIFDRLKILTNKVPFKETLRPLYQPLLEKIKFYFQTKRLQDSGYDVLKQSKLALDELGLTYWLEFGTLLGFVRDGGLIKHDTDLDFGVFLDEYNENTQKVFEKHGFKIVHELGIEDKSVLEQTFEYKGINVDLFYFTKDKEDMFCHVFMLAENKERIIREIHTKYTGFKKANFNGMDFLIPNDEIQRLTDTYGKKYLIPDKNFHTPSMAFNSKLIDKKVIYIS